jgi:two-component system LytT family response regulator
MRVLIVDDEPPARARLRRLLAGIADVEIVGEADGAVPALQMVEQLAPDLLLLDVQMPGANGLDLAASLPDPAPAVVFVTAYDQYALQAFAVAALDYLLKPVAPAQLARALQRKRDRQAGMGDRARPAPGRLLIPDRGRTHVLAVDRVSWLEAADNYVVVHTADQAPLLRRTLAALLQDLGDGFVRTHRSAAVALAHVATVRPRDKGDAEVVLQGGAVVPCSRSHRALLMARLEALART